MAFNETWTAYPVPNVTGFYDIIVYADSVTSNMFSSGLAFSIFLVLYMVFKRYGDEVAFSAASFITLLLSTILWSVGLVDESIVMLMGVLTGAAVVMMWRRH
jgi:hypothetical protein